MDRRRRAPGRAVPRALPVAPRRGPVAAQAGARGALRVARGGGCGAGRLPRAGRRRGRRRGAAARARHLGRAAVKEAEKYLGTPYKWGGSTPQTGFDCSGLMQWAYAQAGIKIPRVTYTQIDAPGAMSVRRSELLPGDLVFFRDGSGNVHHVGMSLGGDKFIHAPHTGDVVKVSSLNERYYAEQFTGGRRFAQAVAGAPAAPVAPAARGAAPPAPPPPPARAAPAAPEAPAAPAIDPRAVAEAKAAAARDAAEARRHNSGLFMKIQEQENRKENERRNSMM